MLMVIPVFWMRKSRNRIPGWARLEYRRHLKALTRFLHRIFYQRLPHPLSHLVTELPVVDGTDANLLCDFMTQVLKIPQ